MTLRTPFRILLEQHVVFSPHTVVAVTLLNNSLADCVDAEELNGVNDFGVFQSYLS